MFAVALALLAAFASVADAEETGLEPPWRTAYAAGVEADDNADYSAAEKSLTEACTTAVEASDAAGQQLVCTKLGQTYAIQGHYKQAEEKLEQLVGRLEAIQSVNPNLVVRSRLELANVRSARADFEGARKAVQGVGPYLPRLRPSDQVEAYVKIAQFYLPIDRQAPGGDLLRTAIRVLDAAPDFDDFRYVRAARRLADALESSNRLHDAQEILAPFVEEARRRFAGEPMADQLRTGYLALAGAYAGILRSRGKGDASAALLEEIKAWRRAGSKPSTLRAVTAASSDTAHRVGESVSPPKLKKKVDPRYSQGALANGAQGTVLLSVEVWPDGRAHRVTILRPLPYGLHWEAIAAIRKWRFQPGMKDGQPVKVAASVEVNFRLGRGL